MRCCVKKKYKVKRKREVKTIIVVFVCMTIQDPDIVTVRVIRTRYYVQLDVPKTGIGLTGICHDSWVGEQVRTGRNEFYKFCRGGSLICLSTVLICY